MPTHTVRVNMLANLEAFLNMLANSAEIMLCIVGLVVIFGGIQLAVRNSKREIKAPLFGKFSLGAGLVWCGLLFPVITNWIVAMANDYSLLN